METPQFVGYSELSVSTARVLNAHSVGDGKSAYVCLSPSPFYGLGGGQMGDQGYIEWVDHKGTTHRAQVKDTLKPFEEGHMVHVNISKIPEEAVEALCSGQVDSVNAAVDMERRRGLCAHHTATHLLHAALKDVLGDGVVQAGSLVAPDRLRFDFTTSVSPTVEHLRAVETAVNKAAKQGTQLVVQEMTKDEALAKNACAYFGDKYGETVRVVEVPGVSIELCGGTHVEDTSECFPFKIVSEGSIAAGTRRIEAVCGPPAVDHLMSLSYSLQDISLSLNVPTAEVGSAVNNLSQRVADLNRDLKKTKERLLRSTSDGSSNDGGDVVVVGDFEGVPVNIHVISLDDMNGK